MVNRALLVGIDNYPDPRNNLNSCVADTLAFRQMLQTRHGFAASDIRLLHNRDATKSNVLAGIDWLVSGSQFGDRLVFFDSSHGYRYPEGDTMVEVLCLYDAFLRDTELVAKATPAPPKSLTAVLDCCHAGGMNKFFFAANGVGLARAKVWRPAAEQDEISLQLYAQVTKFKFFAQAATADAGAVAKVFQMNPVGIAAPKDLSEGASEFNGAVFAACQADQTAAAGSPTTNNLSAFTYALLEELNGPQVALTDLHARVASRLHALNMSQVPRVIAPPGHPEVLTEPFISGTTQATGGSATTIPSSVFDPFEYLRNQLAGTYQPQSN